MSTKIHAVVDALVNPLSFHLTPGQACDLDGSDQLLPNIVADTVLADKGYDADERVIERLLAQGKTAVIPPKRNRTRPRDYDRDLYKARHLIENFFANPQPLVPKLYFQDGQKLFVTNLNKDM
ncbi:transposase [Nostoc sp.]